MFFLFFFQAEDGIRDHCVTGVQTCALPICSHGKGILALAGQPAGRSAAEVAAALYDGGARRLLLDGDYDAAAPFLDAGLVDRVVAYLPHGNASSRPAAGLPWPLLPPGRSEE